MTLDEIWAKAREMMGPNCRVCPECDGRGCKGKIPGVGSMGDGSAWTACVEYLRRVKIRMDTIHEPWEPDASTTLFGVRLAAPLCLAPIGGLNGHNYNGAMSTADWSMMAVTGAAGAGILPFTGDGAPGQLKDGLEAAKANGGLDVATVKPWRDNGKLIAQAQRCAEAGCAGIIVSTHGGRVMTDAEATAKVLPEIRAAVGDRLTIIVDGGIRTGADIFKVLALGADAAMIGRPFVVAAHGGGAEGVELYANTKRAELEYMMTMANCPTVKDITAEKISVE